MLHTTNINSELWESSSLGREIYWNFLRWLENQGRLHPAHSNWEDLTSKMAQLSKRRRKWDPQCVMFQRQGVILSTQSSRRMFGSPRRCSSALNKKMCFGKDSKVKWVKISIKGKVLLKRYAFYWAFFLKRKESWKMKPGKTSRPNEPKQVFQQEKETNYRFDACWKMIWIPKFWEWWLSQTNDLTRRLPTSLKGEEVMTIPVWYSNAWQANIKQVGRSRKRAMGTGRRMKGKVGAGIKEPKPGGGRTHPQPEAVQKQ